MDDYIANKIDDGFWSIEDGGVRCFLFKGDKQSLLIDTGYGTGDLKAAVAELIGEDPMLVLTHADGDHVGCNQSFGLAYMHPAEYAHYHEGTRKHWPAAPLWEGDVIDLGPRRLEVILIPGHTPGSIALLDRANRFLIGGDSIQNGTIFMFGGARDMPAYIESMKKLSKMTDRFDTVYASHADLSVDADFIPYLVQTAQAILDGNIQPTELEPSHRNYGKCQLFQTEKVGFYY